tara:strand:+ start:1799 stop:5698 length:3900 start_codon:yes stop_codon:yes gene_type:complete
MSRKVWKLGKFDKGINSHTDPKDIKDNEWAELEDVNVSKVGVARMLGRPMPDSKIHTTNVGDLISGKGLYRFNSDNSYMPSQPNTSYHELTNTLDGGVSETFSGEKSHAEFSIISAVWAFHTRVTTGTTKFQLYIGSTPITDEFEVIKTGTGEDFDMTMTPGYNNDHGPGETYEQAKQEVNVMRDGLPSSEHWSVDLDNIEDIRVGHQEEDPQNVGFLNRILVPKDFQEYAERSYKTNNSSAGYQTYDWFTNGAETPATSNGDPLFLPRSDQFWRWEEYSHLSDRRLIYDATWNNSTRRPNGDIPDDMAAYPNTLNDGASGVKTYMTGFYKWDGYYSSINEQFGCWGDNALYDFMQPETYIRDSRFVVPVFQNYYAAGHGSSSQTIYCDYYKASTLFMSRLIKAINDYNGGDADDRFWAEFGSAKNAENPTWDSYNTTSYSSRWDYNPRNTSLLKDYIFLEAREYGTITGDIKGKFTYVEADGSGSAGFRTEVVHLLDHHDRYGVTELGQAVDGVEPYIPNNGIYVSDENVSDSTGGGAMVIGPDTRLSIGAAADQKETWKLTLRGYPQSGSTIILTFTDFGSSLLSVVGQDSITIHMVANFDTNEDFANSLKTTIHALSGFSVTASAVADSVTASDVNPGYYILIESSTAGQAHQFGIKVEWINTNAPLSLASIGVEDEQLCLVSKTGNAILHTEGNETLLKTDFRLFSEFSSSWINRFNNSNLPAVGITENNSNKYLNWFYTATKNNDPLFYDEGNILRIIETNFELLKEIEHIAEVNNLSDGISNGPNGYMAANPAQWIGYKDTNSHFGDAYNYSYTTDIVGFFIGKQAKVWTFTENDTGSGIFGLSQTLDDADALAGAADVISANDALMKIYMVKGTSGGLDWTGHIKVYAVACYDDGSESLPGHYFETAAVSGAGYFDSEENVNTLKMRILFRPANDEFKKCFPDIRIEGIRLYYTHSEENHSTFWNLGKFDFNRGFIKASTIDTTDNSSGNEDKFSWTTADVAGLNSNAGSEFNLTVHDGSGYEIEYTEMPKTEAFEDINGFSSQNKTLHVDYKTACIAGRRTFVGNIRVWNGTNYEYYNDRMVVSPINALDTFPYPDNILDLDISDGDEIIALTSYEDKVIQFKKRICYILNISTGIASEFFIEERHKWKGILDKNHFCVTDNGIFWFNERGAWIYNGEEIKDLFILGDEEESQQVLDRDDWNDFVSKDSLVGYNAFTREIIIVKNHTHTNKGDSDCFVFSLIVNSWTKGIKRFFSAKDKSMTNFQNTGSLGKLSYFMEEVPNSHEANQEIR